jgi:chain length determinant protein tyrosine kinase EpsG
MNMDIINMQTNSSSLVNRKQELNIGKILLDIGKITAEDAERVIQLQKREGIRFGEAAQKLRLITEDDIRYVLSLQFDYPYLHPSEGGFSQSLVAAYAPFSPQVEALRALRTQLILRWFNEGHKALAVISPNGGEGASHLAANLAIVFSQLGEHTLLIDANLRNPTQQKLFNIKEPRGLSDVLAARVGFSEVAVKVPSFVDLTVLGAGTIPPNPQELLGRASFAALMNQAQSQYDVVIVDNTPANGSSDVQATAKACEGVLLVSKLNETRLTELTQVRDQMLMTGAQIVGAVINEF